MKAGSLLVGGIRRAMTAKSYLLALCVANLLLGWFATLGLSSQIGTVTGRSLYSQRLLHGFDLGVFLELINKPEISPSSQVPVALVFSALFVVFQLFLTGGIITQYLAPERIKRTRFYAACGENFWKLVRMALVFVVAGGVVAGIFYAINSILGAATENSANRQAAFALQGAMLVIEAVVLLWLRMWFDLAQTHVVASGAPRIRAGISYGFKSTRRAGGLYGTYLVIGILTALAAALGLYLWWTAAPASRVFVSFLILQSTLASLILLRWWQRALAADWYQRNTPIAVLQSVALEPLPPESVVPEVPLSL